MAKFCDHFKLLTACQLQKEIFIQSFLFLTVPMEHPVSVWNKKYLSFSNFTMKDCMIRSYAVAFVPVFCLHIYLCFFRARQRKYYQILISYLYLRNPQTRKKLLVLPKLSYSPWGLNYHQDFSYFQYHPHI